FDMSGDIGFLAGLAPAIISWDTHEIAGLNLTTGKLADDIYVLRNNSVWLFLNSSGGEDNVFLGTNELPSRIIGGVVTIRSSTRILVNDSADTLPHTVTLDNHFADRTFGVIRGLTLSEVRYKYANTLSLTVLTGPGVDWINVQATGVPTTLTDNGP